MDSGTFSWIYRFILTSPEPVDSLIFVDDGLCICIVGSQIAVEFNTMCLIRLINL